MAGGGEHDVLQGLEELWRVVVSMSACSGALGPAEPNQHRTSAKIMAAVVHNAKTYLQEKLVKICLFAYC